MRNSKEERTRSKKTPLVVAAVIVVAIVVIIAATGLYFRNHWYPGTKINGEDFSGSTYEDSREKLENVIKNYKLTITGREDGKDTITGEEIDLSGDVGSNLKKLYEEQHKKFFLTGVFSGFKRECEYDITYDAEKLESQIRSSVLVEGGATYTITKPKSAYVAYSKEKGYGEIIHEVDGNKLRVKKVISYVEQELKNLTETINLDDAKAYPKAYAQPKYRADDEVIQKEYETYNGYLLHWITWDMGKDTYETLTPQDIEKWLSVTKDNQVVLDKDAMAEWVEKFCLKYKTVGTTRKFKTHSGNVIQVSGGDYGWRIDYDKEVAETAKLITGSFDTAAVDAYIKDPSETNQKALTTTKEPSYSNKGYKKDYKNFQNDWDTQNYSEVDLTEQRVYVYKNGKLAFTTTCVTGLPKDNRDTTPGCWYIKDKKEDYTLTSTKYDYEVKTKYWTRITWTGIGYHYANRSDWGRWSPSLYKTNGSHGCVNLTLSDAYSVYSLVKIGDPVFIHS